MHKDDHYYPLLVDIECPVGNEVDSDFVDDTALEVPTVKVHLEHHAVLGVEVDDEGLDKQVDVGPDLGVQIEHETVGEPSVVLTKHVSESREPVSYKL